MLAIIPLIVAMTFGVIGFSMVFPLLPYALRLQGLSEFWQVAVFALFSAASFVASPVWGRLSDKLGRKPVILAGLLGSGGCCLWLYFSSSAIEIYLNRATAGLFMGWLAASHAYVGDWVSEKNRVRGMAMIGIAFGLGFTIGPLSTALMIDYIDTSWIDGMAFFQAPLLMACACYAIAIVVVGVSVKDVAMRLTDELQLSVRQVISQIPIAQTLALLILFQLMFTAVESTLALWVFDRFGGGPSVVGKLLAVAGFASLLTHGSIVGLGRRFHPMALAICGLLMLSLGVVLLALSTGATVAYFVMVTMACGHALFVASGNGFLSRLAPEGWQGCVMGFMQSGNSLARIGGPLSGGSLYEALGNRLVYVALLLPVVPSLFLAGRLWRKTRSL